MNDLFSGCAFDNDVIVAPFREFPESIRDTAMKSFVATTDGVGCLSIPTRESSISDVVVERQDDRQVRLKALATDIVKRFDGGIA